MDCMCNYICHLYYQQVAVVDLSVTRLYYNSSESTARANRDRESSLYSNSHYPTSHHTSKVHSTENR